MEFLKRACDAQAEDEGPGMSRRSLIAGTGAAAGAAALQSIPGTASAGTAPQAKLTQGSRMDSEFLFYEDPAQHQRQSWRVLRNIDNDADVLFWYHFTMFTVPQGRRPEPIVRWEGIEFSHHRELRNGAHRLHGHNLSFPRDLHSGRWTDSVINPVTGETVSIPPMALTEDPGYVYTLDGMVPLDNPDAEPRTRYEQFLIEDDLVKIEQVRLAPASWPATFIETSSNWSSRELYENTDISSLPCGTAGGYVFPWPAWLEMGENPGHMFATWHGRKLDGVEQLPKAFLARAEPDYNELLAVDLSVFDRPLPEPLASRFG